MRAHETLERAGRHGGFPARGSASGLLAACPSDGSHDFYLSMMLDVPVQRGHGQTPLVMAGRGTCGDGAAVPSA